MVLTISRSRGDKDCHGEHKFPSVLRHTEGVDKGRRQFRQMASQRLLRFILMPAMAATLGHAAMKTGPAVGERIPAFSLPDQNGQVETLKTISGPKGAMLVFFRSADW